MTLTNEPTGEAPLPAAYERYTLQQLNTDIEYAQIRIASAKKEVEQITTEVARRFNPALETAMTESQKRSTTLDAGDGFKVKGSVSKTVAWDSDALQTMATTMTWEQIKHYFKIKFSVAEAIFGAMEPGPLKDAMAKARTTKYGDLKTELIAPKA